MKKLLAILLAITMVLTLGACGSDGKKDKGETNKEENLGVEDKAVSYEEAFEKALASKYKCDASNMRDMIPDGGWEYYAELTNMTVDAFIETVIDSKEDAKEWLEESNTEYTYIVDSYEKLTEEEVEVFAECIANEYEGYISLDDIGNEGYCVEFTTKTLHNGEEEKETVETAYLIKINDNWYAIYDSGRFFCR